MIHAGDPRAFLELIQELILEETRTPGLLRVLRGGAEGERYLRRLTGSALELLAGPLREAKAAGISFKTYCRAKTEAGVKSRKGKKWEGSKWFAWLPVDHVGQHGNLGHVDHLGHVQDGQESQDGQHSQEAQELPDDCTGIVFQKP